MSNRQFDKNPDDIVIVAGARTAIGKFGGTLKTVSTIDLGAIAVKEAVKRSGVDPSKVGEVIIGNVGLTGFLPVRFPSRPGCLTSALRIR